MANTPEIRFRGFREPWEQRKLGDTNTFFTDGNYGEAYPKASDMTDSSNGIPFLTGGNLKDGKLDITNASYITPEKHAKLTSGHLLEDDIVIAVRGSLGALGYVKSGNSGWNINSQLAILRTDKSVLSGKYLIQYLLSGIGQKELLIRQTGSALKQLPIGSVKDVPIPITSVEEQTKIGEFLANIDSLITLHQRKYDEIKEVKKYMLQKMFPKNGEKVPEIRFSGFTASWEQRKLGDIADRVTEKNASLEVSETFTNSAEFGIISQRDFFDHDITNKENIGNYFIVRPEDFVYNPRISVTAPVGPINRNKLGRNGVMSPLYTVFRPHDVSNTYLEYFFKTSRWYAFMQFNGDSGARSDRFSIGTDLFYEMPIPAPSFNEQEKIGSFFANLSDLITLHQHKCDELKKVKKFMLQNMFPRRG